MSYTHIGALMHDHRVTDAKKLLLDAVKDQQKKITGIRPPNPELTERYHQVIENYSKQRGANLWYPYLGSGIGKGPLVELLDGSVKYDFICGIGVHHFGHSNHEIISASIDAALCDTVMQGNLQQNADSVDLVDTLIKESKFDHCFLSTSGAMANENAFKVVFQKNYPAERVLAFENGFTGRTLAMSYVCDKPHLRDGLPNPLPVDYVPFYNHRDPEGSTKRAVEVLKKYIWRFPKQHAAMIFELIQGEGGAYPGESEFFKALMTILKDNNIAVFADEVQTFGRTTQLFAFQHFGLDDYVDLVSIGKMAQVCATLWRSEYNPRPGLIAQTFTSSTAAIHTAKTMIHMMFRDGFFGPDGKNMQVHKRFEHHLKRMEKENPGLIQGPYGLGAMVAFSAFDGSMEKAKAFGQALFQEGVISFIAGTNPTRTRFLVPVGAVTMEDIDKVCKIIEETLLCM